MIQEAYQQVRSMIHTACQASHRDPSTVRLIAVSKTKPVEDILEAYQAGCRDFGENYAQEIAEKAPKLPSDIRWHFIGHLQSNKAKKIAPHLYAMHTIDSFKLAKMIHDVKPCELLLQVNIGREEQKSGLLPEQVLPLVRELTQEKILVRGLMCIPPAAEDPEDSRPFFLALRVLQKKLQQDLGLALPELSMGMTADASIAIQEGATMVRVGTAIFGSR